jgi:Flp pilus assembly protein TadD
MAQIGAFLSSAEWAGLAIGTFPHGLADVTLRPATLRQLRYAEGYLLLGLVTEAAETLGEIEEADRELTPVLRFWAEVHVARRDWAAAAVAADTLCKREPGNAGHWIQHAYAVRRAEGIPAAHAILSQGLALHPLEPTIHFNLACYEARLGRLDEARTFLASACRLDPEFVGLAQTDEDLETLRRIQPESG